MNWDVVEVKPFGSRVLAVTFSDGLTGTICLASSFCTGVFQPLLDDRLLEQATVENGVVVWPNGLDLAPDTMYREIKKSHSHHYVVGCRL